MYITEKILHGYYSLCIPIYWGSSNIHEFYNPDSFIYIEDYNKNSVDKAIEKIIGRSFNIKEFNIHAIHSGSDDVSKVDMLVINEGKSYKGYGFSSDIVRASANAYLDALNKFV
jgi:hypothetical protein